MSKKITCIVSILYAKSYSPIYASMDFWNIKDFSVNQKNWFCLKLFHWKFYHRYNSTKMKLFIKYCIFIFSVFGFALLIYGPIKSISLIKLKWPQKIWRKPVYLKRIAVFGWLSRQKINHMWNERPMIFRYESDDSQR